MPTIVWKGNPALFTAGVNTVLLEQPDSPQYVFNKQVKCTRKFRGLHSLCLSSAPGRGTVGTGAMAGWLVSQSTVNRLPKQIGELVIEYGGDMGGGGGGGGGGPIVLPEDDFDLDPFEVNPKTERHPFFSTLTPAERAAVRDSIDNPVATARATAYAALGTLAKKLADKLQAGQETYYLAGDTYTWTTHSWTLPGSLSMGGVLESPGGPLAGHLNTTDFGWLRKADRLNFNGQYYILTSVWMAGPNGHWDTDLCS
jgi:hypothetical protein